MYMQIKYKCMVDMPIHLLMCKYVFCISQIIASSKLRCMPRLVKLVESILYDSCVPWPSYLGRNNKFITVALEI